MSKIIGIDFGTTNSSVYLCDGKQPMRVNRDGSIPSIVAFTDNGPLVGEAARRQAVTNPKRTISGIVRLLGRKYNSQEIESWARSVPYDIVPLPDGYAGIHVYGRIYHPTELAALILAQLKDEAEEYLRKPVTRAVISVPTPYNSVQRQALRDAGRIAGLEIVRVLVASTSAALLAGEKTPEISRIAVLDLGGGTFDITIAETGDNIVETRAVIGEIFGGDDFDQLLVDYLVDEFAKETDIDLSKNDMSLRRLKEAAENARKDLSEVMETEIRLPFIAMGKDGPRNLESRLGRPTLETLVSDAVGKLERLCGEALAGAGCEPKDMDRVYLLGGLSRMPLLRRATQKIFGRTPDYLSAGAVGQGAAMQGAILGGDEGHALLLDCITHSLGIETAGGKFSKILERNLTIPTHNSIIIRGENEEQSSFAINVLQGEQPLARDNISLVCFDMDGLESEPGQPPQIEVVFEVDANRILNVIVRDKKSGREKQVKVVIPPSLPEEEIELLRRQIAAYADEAAAKRERAQTMLEEERTLDLLEANLAKLRELLAAAGNDKSAADAVAAAIEQAARLGSIFRERKKASA